ncbi:N-acetylmuramoyl-L-alanine amidase [Secundilactobacillus malefermentans]|uniref:N-acetylmuramoyl-L-alanine amidase n=1 Tax=Secundilactobacillus malefermentans TaxID=176292 RepID=UPI0011CA7D8B|nr:N-acetylmuramoyl-L-alanine amidase [Secundilactobacillus malefermentans]QEA31059.1 N-acetylmuramoyl-L-alanine amidase [Secundilactobacillus malefermentans]
MKRSKRFMLLFTAILALIALSVATIQPETVTASATTTKKVKKAKKVKKHHYLLVMGHGAGDGGARGNGTTEATVMRKKLMPHLAKYAKQIKNSNVTIYNPKHNIVRDTLVFHKGSYKIKKSTTVIMFHLDAPSGHGGHVIIHKKHPTTRDKKLAKVIKKYVGLNPAYHGYSYRANLRNCNVLRRRGIDYSLVESGFITNKSDYKHFNKNIDKIAKGYVEAIANEKIK